MIEKFAAPILNVPFFDDRWTFLESAPDGPTEQTERTRPTEHTAFEARALRSEIRGSVIMDVASEVLRPEVLRQLGLGGSQSANDDATHTLKYRNRVKRLHRMSFLNRLVNDERVRSVAMALRDLHAPG